MAGGWIHLITGCMFSGKTDEMLRLIRRAEIAGRRVLLVRPAMDDRTAAGTVESRSGVGYQARAVASSTDIPPIVTGQDFLGRPFNSMPILLALADQVTKLTAICTVCGAEATRTQRLVGGRPAAADDPLIVVGGIDDDRYEARCRAHHVISSARGATSAPIWENLPAASE